VMLMQAGREVFTAYAPPTELDNHGAASDVTFTQLMCIDAVTGVVHTGASALSLEEFLASHHSAGMTCAAA